MVLKSEEIYPKRKESFCPTEKSGYELFMKYNTVKPPQSDHALVRLAS